MTMTNGTNRFRQAGATQPQESGHVGRDGDVAGDFGALRHRRVAQPFRPAPGRLQLKSAPDSTARRIAAGRAP